MDQPAGPASYSQHGQDRFVAEVLFNGRRGGVFVDVGAHDGVTFSNSCLLERAYGWTGVCIEAAPRPFALCARNRTCTTLNLAAAAGPGTLEFLEVEGPAEMLSGVAAGMSPAHLRRIEREIERGGGAARRISVPARPLADVLDEIGIGDIDYLSIDVEGGEVGVLTGLFLRPRRVGAITAENNDGDPAAARLLRRFGFLRLCRMGADDVFVPADSMDAARTAIRRRDRIARLGRAFRRPVKSIRAAARAFRPG